jgi:hypothetical protein
LNRFLMALRVFWLTLTDGAFAARVEALLTQPQADADLRVLALLQRDGRLVDFLKEPIDAYPDSQIGASVREIHRGCRKALEEYLTIEPVVGTEEGAPVSLESEFDPAAIRLTGDVPNAPPFRGVLKHHGWCVKAVHLPPMPVNREGKPILAQAEVKIE